MSNKRYQIWVTTPLGQVVSKVIEPKSEQELQDALLLLRKAANGEAARLELEIDDGKELATTTVIPRGLLQQSLLELRQWEEQPGRPDDEAPF